MGAAEAKSEATLTHQERGVKVSVDRWEAPHGALRPTRAKAAGPLPVRQTKDPDRDRERKRPRPQRIARGHQKSAAAASFYGHSTVHYF